MFGVGLLEKTYDDEDEKVKFIGKELSLNRAIHVIGKFLPEENKWLVISAWIRGEEDDGSLSTWQPPRKKSASAGGHPRVAFTKHVRKWMKQQRVNESDIEKIVLEPQKTFNEKDGKVKFIGRTINQSKTIHVIGKFIEKENKWLVITAWMARHKSYRGKRYKRARHKSDNKRDIISIIMFLIIIAIVITEAGDWFIKLFRGFDIF